MRMHYINTFEIEIVFSQQCLSHTHVQILAVWRTFRKTGATMKQLPAIPLEEDEEGSELSAVIYSRCRRGYQA